MSKLIVGWTGKEPSSEEKKEFVDFNPERSDKRIEKTLNAVLYALGTLVTVGIIFSWLNFSLFAKVELSDPIEVRARIDDLWETPQGIFRVRFETTRTKEIPTQKVTFTVDDLELYRNAKDCSLSYKVRTTIPWLRGEPKREYIRQPQEKICKHE